MFDLGLVQDEWKMYVKQPLDREKTDLYVINVTASDGLFVCETTVVVTVTDTNDNDPVFVQVRIELNKRLNYPIFKVLHVVIFRIDLKKVVLCFCGFFFFFNLMYVSILCNHFRTSQTSFKQTFKQKKRKKRSD